MSQPAPMRAPVATDAAPVYRPLSGLAIAGFGLAIFFSGWLIVSTAVAFFTAVPLLMSLAWLLLPIVGAVLSGLGWLQINRSEGTRAGLKLARWGLLLCTISAALFLAHSIATEQAIRLQAREFTTAWFNRLQRSGRDELDSYAAFQDTLEPGRRERRFDADSPEVMNDLRANPKKFEPIKDAIRKRHFWGEAGRKGPLPLFGDHELIHILREAGDQATIEPQGVRRWEYIGGSVPGYLVEQGYRIHTPDTDYQVTITVIASQGRDAERRQWHVVLGESGVRQRKATPRGLLLAALRSDSHAFVVDWTKQLNPAQLDEAFLDTLPPEQRTALRRQYTARLLAAALPAADAGVGPAMAACGLLADRELLRELFLPGYAAFRTGSLLREGGLLAPDPQVRDEVAKEARLLFRPGSAGTPVRLQPLEDSFLNIVPWQLNESEGIVLFRQPCDLRVGPKYHCHAYVIVATRAADVAKGLAPGADGGAINPDAIARTPAARAARWWIVGVELGIVAAPRGGPAPTETR